MNDDEAIPDRPDPPGEPDCDQALAAAAARLAGDPEPLPVAVAAHLASCPRCHDARREHERLWEGLGRLAEEVPSDELRRGLAATLAAYRVALTEVALTEVALTEAALTEAEVTGGATAAASPVAAPAAPLRFAPRWQPGTLRLAVRLGPALAALLAGVAIGLAIARPAAPPDGTAELRAEVRDLRQVLTLSLLAQSSASARLEGVSVGASLAAHDPAVVAALLDTLASDPDPNVRLAAVDALAARAADPGVLRRLGELLPQEGSPLVQIALADALLSADGGSARTLVGRLANDREILPEVREYVRQRLGNDT